MSPRKNSNQRSSSFQESSKRNDLPKRAGKTITKKSRGKKPDGMPKRPLSAYNIFFQQERARMLSASPGEAEGMKLQHSRPKKLGFAELARYVADRWKHLKPWDKVEYEAKAAIEKERYYDLMKIWEDLRLPKRQFKEQEEKDSKVTSIEHPHQWNSTLASLQFQLSTLKPTQFFPEHTDINCKDFLGGSGSGNSNNLQNHDEAIYGLDNCYKRAYTASMETLFSKLDEDSIDFLTTLF